MCAEKQILQNLGYLCYGRCSWGVPGGSTLDEEISEASPRAEEGPPSNFYLGGTRWLAMRGRQQNDKVPEAPNAASRMKKLKGPS